MRRGFLRHLALGATLLCAPTALTGQDRPAERPNIIVMLSDDMGWGQPGFQGGTLVSTPNLDRLAKEGVNLTQFYVQPVCTPTRSALLTGRYPFRTGTVKRFTRNDTAAMLGDERTLAEALRDAGYRTAICGKWHLGEWKKRHLPMQRGFDHQYGNYSAFVDMYTHTRSGVLDWHRNERPLIEEGYSSDLIAKETERLINEWAGRGPFFIYVPFNAVHAPHQAPPEVVEKYRKTRAERPRQAAQLECMDRAVGRILGALDGKGLRDDTIVMFLNDNGDEATLDNLPYRGGKGDYLEGGIRVASVIRWPGRVRGGSVVDEPLHAVDLYPTFVKLAGGSLKQEFPLDGLDAWPTIAEGKPTPHKEIVHGLKCIRMGDWKFIDENAQYDKWKSVDPQLYNVRRDPYEQSNLVAEFPEKVKEMRERLAYYAAQERPAEEKHHIPNYPVLVYGEEENKDLPEELVKRIKEIRASGKDKTMVKPGTRKEKRR